MMTKKIPSWVYKLQSRDILEHELYGDLTILEKDSEDLGYIVLFGDISEKAFISFIQIFLYCRIKD